MVIKGICPVCQTPWEGKYKRQIYCSQPCRYYGQTGNPYKPEVYFVECSRCQKPMERDRPKGRITYCEPCRAIRKRERYRMKTVKRQGALATPRINHEEIAIRDEFVCHICNEQVDMTLPRTARMGATLDHVIPLSKGGTDTRENLKLAHWICNNKKRDKIIGE